MAGRDRITPQGKEFFKQLEELKKLELRVGFQHGVVTDEDSGVDMADVAMWNELGTVRSPPRPFMRQSVDNNADRISAMCRAQVKSIATGEKTVRDALQTLGVMQKALIQDTIKSGNFVPNAPSTVLKKKSDKPLIDKGRMRQSVNYVVQERGRGD